MIYAHLLLGLVGAISFILLWYYGELADLRPESSLTDADEISLILDRKILAYIKVDNLSPKQLAQLVSPRTGGQFFAARYGIGPEFLVNLSSDDPATMPIIWQMAKQMSARIGSDQINSVSIAAALIFAIPGHDQYLAELNVKADDVAQGVAWYAQIQKVIKHHTENKYAGGLGRDIGFGWTPLLNTIGVNVTDNITRGGLLRREIEGHKESIDQLMHVLSQPGKPNAVLVGEPGVGKTTIAYSLAQKLVEEQDDVPEALRYHQMIALDAANLIANAKGRGEIEQLLIQVFNEAISAKNIIIFLDEAQLFLRDGTGTVNLSSILLKVLEGGGVTMVLSLSEQEWLKLSQENAGLAQLMNRVEVVPLLQPDVLRVMEDQTLLLEAEHKVVYMYQSLLEAYKLADRFINEQAFPGKAIKLLEAAAGFSEQQIFVTAKSVQQAVEKSFNVKVQTADTAQEKDVLLNLEEKIHERMINQTRAVQSVSDALRRARAGVRNENKPIGTFLFLGPTGVGKTELSKSLASVYFGGDDKMVRIDLNEFSRPNDTSRLLAVGAEDPYSLCAQIAKQPFSVVLLDEIEKAHPNVLNLLLQMLDEGILRDAQNKPVSFKDAIIIATSNAGADKIRAHIEAGQELEDFEEQFINELITSNIFRPEFLNRFDETVLFRPLKQEELMQVVDLLMIGLNKTLASKQVSVSLSQDAKVLLTKTGYDPRLGARPLRRVVQRAVENLVAQGMLSGQLTAGQTMQINGQQIKQALDKRS
jgi:ATP-dependent Clp protease ATP-binding subunit ClpC